MEEEYRQVLVPKGNKEPNDCQNAFVSSHRRATRQQEAKGFESVQNVIYESIRETERLRRTEEQPNVFLETFKDIQVVAMEALKTLNKWNTSQQMPNVSDQGVFLPIDLQNKSPFPASDTFVPMAENQPHESSVLADLTGILALWSLPIQERLSHRSNSGIYQVHDVVSKAVKGDLHDAANEIWKFAGGRRDSDENTVGTCDTIQEETNQIRRLGSWGTVNTCGTGGTNDTGCNSCEAGQTPREINCVVADDDGNVIDPVLLQKAQKTRGRRTPRRHKLVKFDYPPIKSLRQCPRPDPADLPNLFFTEDELYQIEDDRYSTMSTDDIEIVAVSSNTEEREQIKPKHRKCKSPKAQAGKQIDFSETSPEAHCDDSSPREPPESGWKKPRERKSTPHRRRCEIDDEETEVVAHEQLAKSPSSSGRLVKGVQIFLRERSTGA
jgi:hypothetical protein